MCGNNTPSKRGVSPFSPGLASTWFGLGLLAWGMVRFGSGGVLVCTATQRLHITYLYFVRTLPFECLSACLEWFLLYVLGQVPDVLMVTASKIPSRCMFGSVRHPEPN